MHLSETSETDKQALATALYRQHAQAILLYLRRHTSVREDAEDLLLEVFLRAIEKRIPLDLPEQQQRAWLLHVARRKMVDHYRQRARHPSLTLDEVITGMLLADEDHAPEHTALRNEDHRLLREHFASLPEPYQRVLWLRFASGLRSKAIGQSLHKSDGAVRILLSRALNSLRRSYMHDQGDSQHEAE